MKKSVLMKIYVYWAIAIMHKLIQHQNVFVSGIFGGFLLGVKSSAGLALYDWDTLDLVRVIEIQPKAVYWSESGELVCIATQDSYFILRYDPSAVVAARQAGTVSSVDGVEEAFDVS